MHSLSDSLYTHFSLKSDQFFIILLCGFQQNYSLFELMFDIAVALCSEECDIVRSGVV